MLRSDKIIGEHTGFLKFFTTENCHVSLNFDFGFSYKGNLSTKEWLNLAWLRNLALVDYIFLRT